MVVLYIFSESKGRCDIKQGASKRDLPSSGGNTIAETVTNCGSAGGGVAIMLTLYELWEFWVGIHSRRCRGQSYMQIVPGQRRNGGVARFTDTVDMFWRTIPSALAATTPHRRRSAAQGTWVVDEWYGVHVRKKLEES